MAFRNVVVAVNGSPASDLALARAMDISRAASARLAVLGVEEPAPIFAQAEAWGRRDGQLHAAVEAAVDLARQAGVEAAGLIRAGYPAEVIVVYSVEQRCDLVVIGAGDRGPGAIGRMADKVVDLAPCAVLVVR